VLGLARAYAGHSSAYDRFGERGGDFKHTTVDHNFEGLFRRVVRRKSLEKVKDTIRAKTKRNNGQSLQVIIANVNRTTQGWFSYFKHSHRYTFDRVDRLVRVRLRSILRSGQRGHSRGSDSQRWSNAFLAQHGLFSLVAAHARLRQPLTG
jgi:RNA-directed DNA polymerase